ncbi:hypothetical protein LTR50_003475 [Elasticomyces elasticus]|nr:hypothetical protein LTR50_003475 [Elasticomyces elasticus]
MDFLLYSTSRAIYDFVRFADSKKDSGKLDRMRLIVPGSKRLMKWLKGSFSREEDHYSSDHHAMDDNGNGVSNLYLGQAFGKRKDPEHLPPTNGWQKFGNRIRSIPHFLRSPESSFGLRVAAATMCVAIVGFLHDTQRFYTAQRLFWAQIMITISMAPSAGESLFSFTFRIFGTFMAMCSSLVVYYIVDGHTPGVLVFFFLFVMWGFYIVLKHPRYVMGGMIYSVTTTLIIGYQLQVDKVGIAVSTSNGQLYYPVYQLAPYRLATVCGGLLVAWIWTFFPFPVSDHSQLRKNLGSSLYLLANFYSVVHETVKARIRGDEGDMTLKTSPGRRLEKARNTVFAKSLLLLGGLRTRADFVRYDIPIGGRFPAATYAQIIDRVQSIIYFTALISYASVPFTVMTNEGDQSESEWLLNFRKLIKNANVTSHEVTYLVSLLSASITSGQPLPPYLRLPEPYALTQRLEEMDRDVLSVRHIAEPGYASFAVMQIATKCIIQDLKKLMECVIELVGELDFSYHLVSTADESSKDSLETLWSRDAAGESTHRSAKDKDT